MSISISTKQAYSEIDEFLSLLTEEERNKIPERLRDFFKENKDKYYQKNINPNLPIKDQNLLEETLTLIAFLNLKYWCEDEKEKERLTAIYLENDKKYHENLKNQLPHTSFTFDPPNPTIHKPETNMTKTDILVPNEKISLFQRFIKTITKMFIKK